MYEVPDFPSGSYRLDFIRELLGDRLTLLELCLALPISELDDCAEWIARNWGIELPTPEVDYIGASHDMSDPDDLPF